MSRTTHDRVSGGNTLTVNPEVVAEAIGQETVLCNFATEQFLSLNPVGSHVWQLIEAGRPIDDITESIRSTFDAPADELERDVESFVSQLVAFGIATRT